MALCRRYDNYLGSGLRLGLGSANLTPNPNPNRYDAYFGNAKYVIMNMLEGHGKTETYKQVQKAPTWAGSSAPPPRCRPTGPPAVPCRWRSSPRRPAARGG